MDFKNVDKKYRPIPFWSWNEKLNTEETKDQIKTMDEAVEDTADAVDITELNNNNEESIKDEVKEIKKPRTRKAKNNE